MGRTTGTTGTTTASGWKRINARFPGKCPVCGLDFPKGEKVQWKAGEHARHLTCPAAPAAPAALSAAALAALAQWGGKPATPPAPASSETGETEEEYYRRVSRAYQRARGRANVLARDAQGPALASIANELDAERVRAYQAWQRTPRTPQTRERDARYAV